MVEYGSIYIEQLSEEGMGGGQYFKDIKRELALDILQKIQVMAKDFILANDCHAEIVPFNSSVKDKSVGFYILNRTENGLVKILYQPEYESETEEKNFNQVFDKILSRFFKVKNPASLLKKIDSEQSRTDGDSAFELMIRGFLY